MIYWTTVLALLWTALQGKFTLANLVGGFILGVCVLLLLRPLYADQPPLGWKISRVVVLVVDFLRAMFISNFEVARACLRRNPDLHPSILMIPLEAKTDAEISTLANMTTLTPGTMSLHISPERDELYFHALFGSAENQAAIIEGVKHFERRVMEASK